MFNLVFTRLVTFFDVTPKRNAIAAPTERIREDLAKNRRKETKGFLGETGRDPSAYKMRGHNKNEEERGLRQDRTKQSKLSLSAENLSS
ncbi:hypothetical protein D8674_010032 [Pyrus ussuriensis x Pyrus communis]|uniref:Uncharacterized protein n=1 Tax=Pyrus ussuriensis x Pyrus communis TaxID=2448454 RepID=A0A5N5FD39_9ROSA|nr:hypothetical protein D8674_010032 [Pyrus ussuriensis x Pyrus communis]